jgi:hypothetical protein
MIQRNFAQKAVDVLKHDDRTLGLAVGGSWLTDQLDEFSDLDLILVTKEKISGNKTKMIDHAKRLGSLLSGFTGEHVGEPRLLICLYDDPLLHVDIKFLTLDEFERRVETPVILLDKEGQLQKVLEQTESKFPYPDYQWIEDRFWVWVHYALLKIGRGEYMEALDFFAFLRQIVFGPLLHIRNGKLPKGVRKVESQLPEQDFNQLVGTIPTYSRSSLLSRLQYSIKLYQQLRAELFPSTLVFQTQTESKVLKYFSKIAGSK